MSDDLVERLNRASVGRVEWRVQDPASKTFCMFYVGHDSERAATAWLNEHRARYPNSKFAGYEVARVFSQDRDDKLKAEAATEIERLRRIEARYTYLRDVWGSFIEIAASGEHRAGVSTPQWRGKFDSFDDAIDEAMR